MFICDLIWCVLSRVLKLNKCYFIVHVCKQSLTSCSANTVWWWNVTNSKVSSERWSCSGSLPLLTARPSGCNVRFPLVAALFPSIKYLGTPGNLQRLLFSLRGEWQWTFFITSQKTLLLISSSSFSSYFQVTVPQLLLLLLLFVLFVTKINLQMKKKQKFVFVRFNKK